MNILYQIYIYICISDWYIIYLIRFITNPCLISWGCIIICHVLTEQTQNDEHAQTDTCTYCTVYTSTHTHSNTNTYTYINNQIHTIIHTDTHVPHNRTQTLTKYIQCKYIHTPIRPP